MLNKYTGEVRLPINGKSYTLVYDWRAMSKLYSDYGRDAMSHFEQNPDPAILANILAIGMNKHHPEVTADFILDASPPMVAAADAVHMALLYCMHGPEAEKLVAEYAAGAETDKKK